MSLREDEPIPSVKPGIVKLKYMWRKTTARHCPATQHATENAVIHTVHQLRSMRPWCGLCLFLTLTRQKHLRVDMFGNCSNVKSEADTKTEDNADETWWPWSLQSRTSLCESGEKADGLLSLIGEVVLSPQTAALKARPNLWFCFP